MPGGKFYSKLKQVHTKFIFNILWYIRITIKVAEVSS